jgi:hypothetical protein
MNKPTKEVPRETREGWLTDKYDRGSFVGWFIGLVVLVQEIVVLPWLL